MKEVSESDILDNYPFWRRANLLSDIKKPCTINEIASKLGDSISNSYFRNFLKILIKNDFITVDDSRIPHVYNVKWKELSWFITEGGIGCQIKINHTNRMGWKPSYLGF